MSHVAAAVTVGPEMTIPGVTRIEMQVPGVCVGLARFDATATSEVHRVPRDHVLTFLISPEPEVNMFASAAFDGGRFFEAGRLMFLPAGVPYRSLNSKAEVRTVTLRIDPARFREATGIADSWSVQRGFNMRNAALEHDLWRLAREIAAPGFACGTMAEGLSLSVMAELSRILNHDEQAQRSAAGKLSARDLRRIVEYVEACDGSSPAIADLASLIGMSSRQLSKLFRQTTGRTVHDHVAELRLGKAASLLSATRLPIKEIAHRVGFAAPASFSAAFSAAKGMSPIEFRRLFAASPVGRA
jgi:AraC family transcriptional regulator